MHHSACSILIRYVDDGNKLELFFVLAGPSSDLPSETLESIEYLSKAGVLLYYPDFLDENSLYKLISLSYSVWCVQNGFYGSSGIFTRSCAFGVPPIVAKSSTIGELSRKYNLGYH